MTHSEIRNRFLDFFKERGHNVAPSSSLIPDDQSVLFTTAGMQQFKPYYINPESAPSKNTASIQKCLRTSDIDDVGDESHLTFFEMLGNFSFGGYWKGEAIRFAYDFIAKEMKLKIDYVSVFVGDDLVPADDESRKIWKSIDPQIEIREAGRKDNFWGPTGSQGPCGPTTEIYVNGTEVWNVVFNEFNYNPDTGFTPLKAKGIDTGMGLERLAMVSQGKKNIFETDLFNPVMEILPQNLDEKIKRIIADHSRAIVFLISNGVIPSNKDRGYVLRKLIRRIMVHSHISNFPGGTKTKILNKIIEIYQPFYPEIKPDLVFYEFKNENEKFRKTLHDSLREMGKLKSINAKEAFRLYESFGLPYEIIKEVGGHASKDLTREQFEKELEMHKEISRAGASKKFGGHGISELESGNADATKLHTATHLLQAALRKVLGSEVQQAGSDITPERLRFDFTFSRKLTSDELNEVEKIINEAIKADYPISRQELSYVDAIKSGALAFFKQKYPEMVSIYTIGDETQPFSREICGGPHVTRTGEIGEIKLQKDESVSAGVRRIRAILG